MDTGVGSGWASQQHQRLCHPRTNDTLQVHEAKSCLAPEEPSAHCTSIWSASSSEDLTPHKNSQGTSDRYVEVCAAL